MSAADIAQGQLDAYNRQDLDAHCAFYADDIAVADLNGAESVRGIEAYRARYQKLFADFPENRADLVSRIVIADTVIDHERVARTAGGETFDVAAIYTMRGDKIARVDFVRG